MILYEWSNLLTTTYIPKTSKYIDFHQVPSIQGHVMNLPIQSLPLPQLY